MEWRIAEVGRLIDSLASDGDMPWPRTLWPAMRFSGPRGFDGNHRLEVLPQGTPGPWLAVRQAPQCIYCMEKGNMNEIVDECPWY